MGKQLTKSADKRKPKHGLDAARPSASKKGQRDAATVSCRSKPAHLQNAGACRRCTPQLMPGNSLLSAAVSDPGCSLCGQVRRLKMYSNKAKRDKKGKIIHQVLLTIQP